MRTPLRDCRKFCSWFFTSVLGVLFSVNVSLAADLPRIKIENGAGQLMVNGQPFLILGGELGNSSAGTAAQADTIIPNVARMHVNMARRSQTKSVPKWQHLSS